MFQVVLAFPYILLTLAVTEKKGEKKNKSIQQLPGFWFRINALLQKLFEENQTLENVRDARKDFQTLIAEVILETLFSSSHPPPSFFQKFAEYT